MGSYILNCSWSRCAPNLLKWPTAIGDQSRYNHAGFEDPVSTVSGQCLDMSGHSVDRAPKFAKVGPHRARIKCAKVAPNPYAYYLRVQPRAHPRDARAFSPLSRRTRALGLETPAALGAHDARHACERIVVYTNTVKMSPIKLVYSSIKRPSSLRKSEKCAPPPGPWSRPEMEPRPYTRARRR